MYSIGAAVMLTLMPEALPLASSSRKSMLFYLKG
jgi:hypothetical protein